MVDSLQQQIASLEQRIATQPKSPLFARLASYYLQSGRPQDALRVCDQGLASYPFYTTAHLIKGKALLELKMQAEARHEFEVVHEMLPSNEAVERLLSDVGPTPSEEISALAPEPTPAQPAEMHRPVAPESAVKVVRPPQKAKPAAEAPVAEQQAEPEAFPHAEEAVAEPPAVQEEAPSTVEPVLSPEAGAEVAVGEPQQVEEQPVTEENAFGMEQPAADMMEAAPGEQTPVEAETTEPVAVEDPFGLGAQTAGQEPATEELQPTEETTSSLEDAFAANFGALQTETEFPSEQTGEEPSALAQQFESSFGETFDQFSDRIRSELGGTENTMSLEEYLSSGDSSAPAAQESSIEDLAEKLQTAKKITPVINLSEKTVHTASEAETPAGTSFVTPTLAEIYAKQGWFDDAIKAYKTLAANKPAERERFERRIKELEELKKQQG